MSDTNNHNEIEKQALGKRIRGLRDGYGWTLDELSQRTKQVDLDGEGVSKVSISRYENGDSVPGYREIKLLSQALATTVTNLFYGESPDPYSPWHITLDDYLRNLIKDVLIDHKLIEGVSQRELLQRKAMLVQAIEESRRPIAPEENTR